ncbi:hypothetical protein DVH05_028585 [Phytophthora capsici]|nr:hypothetical protein DVH05_028585 [Phytophthora capsici]
MKERRRLHMPKVTHAEPSGIEWLRDNLDVLQFGVKLNAVAVDSHLCGCKRDHGPFAWEAWVS